MTERRRGSRARVRVKRRGSAGAWDSFLEDEHLGTFATKDDAERAAFRVQAKEDLGGRWPFDSPALKSLWDGLRWLTQEPPYK